MGSIQALPPFSQIAYRTSDFSLARIGERCRRAAHLMVPDVLSEIWMTKPEPARRVREAMGRLAHQFAIATAARTV